MDERLDKPEQEERYLWILELPLPRSAARLIPAFRRPRAHGYSYMRPEPPEPQTRYVSQRISVTAIIQIVLILGTMVAGWVRFDARVRNIEIALQGQQDQISRVTDVMTKLDRTLDRLNQTLTDFPPHRHDKDGDIEYPYGASNRAFDNEDLKK